MRRWGVIDSGYPAVWNHHSYIPIEPLILVDPLKKLDVQFGTYITLLHTLLYVVSALIKALVIYINLFIFPALILVYYGRVNAIAMRCQQRSH